MGDFGYTRRDHTPNYYYEPTGIGRGFGGAGRGIGGMGTANGFARRPGLPPRRDASHFNLDPEHLKLMQRAKSYVPYLKLRKKHIFRDKRERQLASEVEDIEFCLEVILDVTIIEKAGFETLKQAFDRAVEIANRNPLNIDDHKSELEEGDAALLGDAPTPANPSAVPPTSAGDIQTDFNFNPYAQQQSQRFSTPSRFPPATPEYFAGSQPMQMPNVQHMPPPGSFHTSYRPNEFHPTRQDWPRQEHYAAPHPATPGYNLGYPPNFSHGSRFQQPGFSAPYGPSQFQQRPPPPSNFYDQSDYRNPSNYDSYPGMNSHQYIPRSQFSDPVSTGSYQEPPQPAPAQVYRNPQNTQNTRARPHFQNANAGHSRQYFNPHSISSSATTPGALPRPSRYEPATPHISSSRPELTNITRDKAVGPIERDFRGSRPVNPSSNVNQRTVPIAKPDIRPYQPSNRPPRTPIKLNQPLELQQTKVPGRSSTLSSNQIPAEPRTNQNKKPEKNLQETVERVKNSIAAKPPLRKGQLEDFRKKATQSNPSLTQKRKVDPVRSSRGSSEELLDASAEDPIDSPVSISSEEFSQEQDLQRTSRAPPAKKAGRKQAQTQSKAKKNPVIKLPVKSNKVDEARKHVGKTDPKKRKLSESKKDREVTNKRQKVSSNEPKLAARNKITEKTNRRQEVSTKETKSSNTTTTLENSNETRKVSRDKEISSHPIPTVLVDGDSSAEDSDATSRVSAPVLRSRKKPVTDKATTSTRSPPDQPKRTTRTRKRTLPLVSSSESEDSETRSSSVQDQLQPLSATGSQANAARNLQPEFSDEDDKGYGYVERIVPRRRYAKTTDHLPQIPPAPSNEPRVVGVADIFVNPGGFKIKIESDYLPPVAIKSEPVDDHYTPEEEEPAPISELNEEDDLEKQMEAMFNEDTGPGTEAVPLQNNIVLEEVDVSDDEADEESRPVFSIRIREFNSILEPADVDNDEPTRINFCQHNSETQSNSDHTIDPQGEKNIQAPIDTGLASMFAPLSSLEDGIRIKTEPVDHPDVPEDEVTVPVSDQNVVNDQNIQAPIDRVLASMFAPLSSLEEGITIKTEPVDHPDVPEDEVTVPISDHNVVNDTPVKTRIKSEENAAELSIVIQSVCSVHESEKKPSRNDLKDKKSSFPVEEVDPNIRPKVERPDDYGDHLPCFGPTREECPFPNCGFHGPGPAVTSHIVNQHGTSSLIIPSAILMPELRQLLKILSVQTGIPRLMRIEIESENWACIVCNAMFPVEQTSSFFDHITSHTGEFRFSCNICDMRFALDEEARIHIQDTHSKDPETDNRGRLKVTPSPSSVEKLNEIHAQICDTCGYFQLTEQSMENHCLTSKHPIEDTTFVLLHAPQPHLDNQGSFNSSLQPHYDNVPEEIDLCLPVDETDDADRAFHDEIEKWIKSGQLAVEKAQVADTFIHYDAKWHMDDPDDTEDVVLYGLVADPEDGFPVSAEDSKTVEDYWQEWFRNHELQLQLKQRLNEDEESDEDEEMETSSIESEDENPLRKTV